MSKSQKLQFLAKIQECCRSNNPDDAATEIETLARTFSQEHGLLLEELLSIQDARKRTILHYVCRSWPSSDFAPLLRVILLEWLPDPASRAKVLKQKDKDGLTCLMMAVQRQVDDCCWFLLPILQAAPKLGLVRSKAGATALHYAAGAGARRSTLEALWEHGKVALHTFALQGGTPLHWACSSSNDIPETIQTLIDCGADVNACSTRTGTTTTPLGEGNAAGVLLPPPLALALAMRQNANACALLSASPEIAIDRVLSGGETTFLHMAVEHDMSDALKLMLAKLDDDDKKNGILQYMNKDGLTPLDLAKQREHTTCIELLHQANASRTIQSADQKLFHTVGRDRETPGQEVVEEGTTTEVESSSSDVATPPEKKAHDRLEELNLLPEVSRESAETARESKERGNECFQRKEWQKAHDWYSAAIQSNPRDATIYSNRSACRIQLGNPRDALLDAILARTLRPEWTKPCYRKAVALLELQRYQDAALAAYEGLQLVPSNVELQKLLRTIVKQGRQVFQQSKEAPKDDVNSF